MEIREGEQILKVYHHHPTPFVFIVLKVIVGSFPFFLLLFLFDSVLSDKLRFIAHVAVFLLFSCVLVYVSLIFWLDKLIVTNQRVIYVDWKYLTVRHEAEALLKDIQDVQTKEKGFLASLWVFDYGFLRLDTPSSYVTIEFFNAPDPEGIRKFIYHVKNV
jgi:hypothetical protein